MSALFLVAQGALSLLVVLSIIERARSLMFRAPVSGALAKALSDALENQRTDSALRLARQAPQRWASRVVIEANSVAEAQRAEQIALALADLRVEAEARLGLIRVSATLASTLGLLGAIVAVQRGFSGHGLLALSAGLAQRVALGEALTHMAIGMGTAAVSFVAFGLLRRAARDAFRQASQVAARCGCGQPRRG